MVKEKAPRGSLDENLLALIRQTPGITQRAAQDVLGESAQKAITRMADRGLIARTKDGRIWRLNLPAPQPTQLFEILIGRVPASHPNAKTIQGGERNVR